MKKLMLIAGLSMMSVQVQAQSNNKGAVAKEAETPKASFANARDKDGNFLGVKLVKIENSPALVKLGVKSGDIVISIEGSQVKSLSDFVKRFEPVFSNSKSVNFEVVRGDLRLQFSLEPESR